MTARELHHGGMQSAEPARTAAEPVIAHVELVLEPEGVRGTLKAEHTPELHFSGWLGLAVAVDQCRRAAE
jgi:hypothetical protein